MEEEGNKDASSVQPPLAAYRSDSIPLHTDLHRRLRAASTESGDSQEDSSRVLDQVEWSDEIVPALFSAISARLLCRSATESPTSLLKELRQITKRGASRNVTAGLELQSKLIAPSLLDIDQLDENRSFETIGSQVSAVTMPQENEALRHRPSNVSVDQIGSKCVVSASTEPIVIDRATAAAINLHNRNGTDEFEADSSEDSVRSFTTTIGMGTTNVAAPNILLSNVAKDTACLRTSQSVHLSPRKKHRNRSTDAWQKFSANIRKMGHAEHPACSYLDRHFGAHGLRRHSVLQKLILKQAEVHGKYVQWTPSMELAFSSCAETEIVDAAKIISKILLLRETFIQTVPDCDSPCIFQAAIESRKGEGGSTEPLFDPYKVKPLGPCAVEYKMEDGVFMVYWSCSETKSDSSLPMYNGQKLLSSSVPSVSKFLNSLKEVMAAVQHPGCKTFAFRRLQYLQNRFSMHLMFNSAAELQETKNNNHRDFYNVRKVDTHVHHSACMHQKHLLRFIRKKYRTDPDEVVAKSSDGLPVTLSQIFEEGVGVAAYDTSVDLLNVHALASCFHRFDIFNSKYNPFGQALLREVFLKTDNLIGGRFLAELTQEVIADLEEAKYQFVEWRVSIYGKSRDEWLKLAKWVQKFKLCSKQVRWMVQVPRLYHVYRKLNLVKNFGELLSNIFDLLDRPLFDTIKNPEKNPEIYYFLLQMNGFDSVDDESVVSKYTSEGGSLPLPEKWVEATNPPYSYWGYYMYSNIQSLNILLHQRGMRTLPFRPHCGETGSISHLASMYLLSNGINHGIMLRKSPVLQYLYYLQQIGLAVSPLSNNALFHAITKNPFHTFFSIGLNVSLSTDDPLMFHFTDEPLLEEYSCCAHMWKLSPVDLCEIARNSVLQSHFEPQLKRHWLGTNYTCGGRLGNSITHSNLSNIRAQYREDTITNELKYVRDVLQLQAILDEVVG